MTQVILMDIEGTTTAIDFVHKTLFPYARAHMASFLDQQSNEPAVKACLEEAATTLREENGTEPEPQAVRDALIRWIDEDRKHPALKKLQGMIWKKGYRDGAYKAHIYDDVLPRWQTWLAEGKVLAIYSSGSVQAQKLLFGHCEAGDLNPHLSHYFDTAVGHKREADSYRAITREIGVLAEEILFLSDVPEELDAAREAGMKTTQLVRPGTSACAHHPTAADFDQVSV